MKNRSMARLAVAVAAGIWLAAMGCIIVSKEEHHYDKDERTPAIARKATCPVDGVSITDLSSAPCYTYRGKTRYFCCGDCRAKFEANPDSYSTD
ncbi:MAG: YHS domain-containing protein [Planctomycetes bacterium]|nr:YHS domain-containing protein [Planctomycetota bacterium]